MQTHTTDRGSFPFTCFWLGWYAASCIYLGVSIPPGPPKYDPPLSSKHWDRRGLVISFSSSSIPNVCVNNKEYTKQSSFNKFLWNIVVWLKGIWVVRDNDLNKSVFDWKFEENTLDRTGRWRFWAKSREATDVKSRYRYERGYSNF